MLNIVDKNERIRKEGCKSGTCRIIYSNDYKLL